MSKGAATRQIIVDHATRLASTVGLEAISIGKLAEDLKLSKSGLFAHFRSKENLQIQVIRGARDAFVEQVMLPALRVSRGEPRVRALFERWLEWGARPGGCLFVSAAAELDDRPGPVRDELVRSQRDWLDALAHAAGIAIDEGHFGAQLDATQFAFELYSLMLANQYFDRFIRDPEAGARTRRAFEALVDRARA